MMKGGITLKRIRTIKAAVNDIKAQDPDSAISYHAIRTAIIKGELPAQRSGNKFLVDLDVVVGYFAGEVVK